MPSEHIRDKRWHLPRQNCEWRQTQLKFCTKSDLPARINSAAPASTSLPFQCRISHAQAHEKVTSTGITCWRVVLFCVFVLCWIFCVLTEPRYRLSPSGHSSPTLNSYPVLQLFFFLNIPPFVDALHRVPTVDSHQRGLPLSSVPATLFLAAKKDKKKQVTKTTVDTFTASDWAQWKRKHAIMCLPSLWYSCLIIETEHAQAGECSQKRGHVNTFHTITVCEHNDPAFIRHAEAPAGSF